jgi:NitT/TauT family transport system substrate-binding protein
MQEASRLGAGALGSAATAGKPRSGRLASRAGGAKALRGGVVGVAALLGGCLALGCGTPNVSAPEARPPATGATSTIQPPPRVAMRFGVNSLTADMAPTWVAKEAGFFAKYGIDVELLTIPGADLVVSSVLSGEMPMSGLAAPALVNSVLGGSDLVFVGSYSNFPHYWFYARPEIGAVRDLGGSALAITSRGGVVRRITDLSLRRNGLDPERDVTLVTTGNIPNSLSALLSGGVSAAMLGIPAAFEAEDAGMHLLEDGADHRYLSISSGIIASRPWLASNGELVRRVLQAIGEGLAFAHRDKDGTMQIISQYLQTQDASLVERSYNAALAGWERTLYAPPEAVRADLEAAAQDYPAARDARPEQFVDNRFVEELDRAGLFRQLFP